MTFVGSPGYQGSCLRRSRRHQPSLSRHRSLSHRGRPRPERPMLVVQVLDRVRLGFPLLSEAITVIPGVVVVTPSSRRSDPDRHSKWTGVEISCSFPPETDLGVQGRPIVRIPGPWLVEFVHVDGVGQSQVALGQVPDVVPVRGLSRARTRLVPRVVWVTGAALAGESPISKTAHSIIKNIFFIIDSFRIFYILLFLVLPYPSSQLCNLT